MVDHSTGRDGKTKAINIEVPGEDQMRYVSVEMPPDQYEMLDDLKSEYGMTWRGLLMHSRRELNGLPEGDSVDEMGQYELVNKTRQRHGLTWKGMLLFAGRDLRPEE
ncbi:hypothetical protein [Saliphagus sp. LR7]|uniref:hypothetical protein n=1 Tax=Saliphagus sp. LR7 TaxID=2282654 RepID=UPI001300845E|nr:hypothetical protein [Saliphagus sp. LR7]